MIYLIEVAIRHSSHQEIKVCRVGSEIHRVCNSVERVQWYRLVEWPWLQLMYCAVCLPHGYNFRGINEVWDGSEYQLGVSLLNTGDRVQ